jgi:hypothetical protein
MKRQIYGLEEAGIIPREIKRAQPKSEASQGFSVAAQRKLQQPGTQQTMDTADANSGEASLGNLDIGWLNSRSGQVGREMEAELWSRARKFLEELEAEKNGQSNDKDHEEDQIMTD